MMTTKPEIVTVRVLTTDYYGQTCARTVTVANDPEGIRRDCCRRFGAPSVDGLSDDDVLLVRAAIDGRNGIANVPIDWHVRAKAQTIHQRSGCNVPPEDYTHVVLGMQHGSAVIEMPVRLCDD